MSEILGAARQGISRFGPKAQSKAALVAVALLVAACGGGDQVADVRAQSSGLSDEHQAILEAAGDDDGMADAMAEVEEQVGLVSGGKTGEGIVVQRYTIPYVPPITLPDVSVLDEAGVIIEASLGELAGSDSGLAVLGAECSAAEGALVYSGSDEARSLFDVETDGSGTYQSAYGDAGGIQINVGPDGSGSYQLVDGEDAIQIDVAADGSGSYHGVSASEGDAVSIDVEADSSGRFQKGSGSGGSGIDVVIGSDGSGSISSFGSGTGTTALNVNADGTGTYIHESPDGDFIDVTAGPDGSRQYTQASGQDVVSITVNADGSGTYNQNFGANVVSITVDDSGDGTYSSVDANGVVNTTFSTEIGILDPAVVVVGPEPTFAVADRFPPLAKLAPLQPPCVTIIRLDANVLFDFDSDQLRPEAATVVAEAASALIKSGKPLVVHGHTDAKGDDVYNQDLSERRADSFAAALVAQGVSTEISTAGFGESRPAAPNETADGADNPAGRQLNRRIEIVIPK